MSSPSLPLRLAALALAVPLLASAQVVINEILYHAPDDLDDLQFVELHNAGEAAVDLGGWAFTKGIKFTFPAGTKIDAKGFAVVCRNQERFREFYGVPVAGVFHSKLSRKGELIELADAQGQRVDKVKFSDQAPWPQGADGESGSLERICPKAPSDGPANWISSPLSETREKPAGTPGKVNAAFARSVPPVVANVSFAPELPAAGVAVVVQATLPATEAPKEVNLRFRLAGPGFERPESVIPMQGKGGGRFEASIPGQTVGTLIRFRVEAVGKDGSRRHFPAETEPRPALSAYVPEPVTPGKIPFGWVIQTTEKEMKAADARANQPAFGMFREPDPKERARMEARRALENGLDLSALWFALTTEITGDDFRQVATLRPLFLAKLNERRKLRETFLEVEDPADMLAKLPDQTREFMGGVIAGLKPLLNPGQQQAVQVWLEKRGAEEPGFRRMVRNRVDLETIWHALTLNSEPDPSRWAAQRQAIRELAVQRAKVLSDVPNGPGFQPALFREVREKADGLRDRLAALVKPTLAEPQVAQLDNALQMPREVVVGWVSAPPDVPPGPFGGPGPRGPSPMMFGGPGGPGGPGGFRGGPFGSTPSEPGSFRSAFVHFDPATGKTELFDFVQISGRKGGQKVHLDRDHTLAGMTTFALIFEGDTASLVEPLAYEVYRRAGMPVEQSHFVRLWVNGKLSGYTVLVEQPNRAFLRRNGLKDDGDMFKLIWFGGDLVGQHERHTHRRLGHDALTNVVAELNRLEGDAQWEFIRRNFDVEEVANYFAVNMVLSHWDGFFNNYFAYHDRGGTGKWLMFPWDQDSTWGLRTFGGDSEVFYNMALTFGMNGDNPPADGGNWRAPGFFSGPLLANPKFRQVFLSRTRQILENVYSEAAFGPVLDRYAEVLLPEVKLRAESQKQDPERAVAQLKSDLARCRVHLQKRREFLLAQPELQRAVSVPPTKGN